MVIDLISSFFQAEDVLRDLALAGILSFFFFFQAEDGIRDLTVTGVQTCALPILRHAGIGPDLRLVHGIAGAEETDDLPHVVAPAEVVADLEAGELAGRGAPGEIGRASCRERV